MAEKRIPFEKFEPPFFAEAQENENESRRIIEIVLKFLEKEVIPDIEKFEEEIPDSGEIRQRKIRTLEDAKFLLATERSIEGFIKEQEKRIIGYIKMFSSGVSNDDRRYMREYMLRKMQSSFTCMKKIARTAKKKREAFEGMVARRERLPEERSIMEDAIKEAGERYNVPVDKLLK